MTTRVLGEVVKKPYKLAPGYADKEYLRLLIDISPIRSNKVIKALHEYFVFGETRAKVCEKHDVNQGYLSIKIKELNLLNERIAKLLPYYV